MKNIIYIILNILTFFTLNPNIKKIIETTIIIEFKVKSLLLIRAF